jgi:hypothetical protein
MAGRYEYRHAATMAVALMLGTGCTPDFDDVWQVKDLRILAIKADPPEVLARGQDALGATSFPPVEITTLVVDPRLDPQKGARTWHLAACTPEERTCVDAHRSVVVAAGRTPLDQIKGTFTLTPDLLQAAIQKDNLRGFGGVPIHLHLRIWDPELVEPVEAIKRLVYGVSDFPVQVPPAEGTLGGACRGGKECDAGLSCDSGQCIRVPNQNPALEKITADGKPIPDQDWEVAAGEVVKLLPAAREGDDEPYWVNTFTGGTRKLDEYVSYAFFVTSGKLKNATTGGPPTVFAKKKSVEDLSSEWTPLETGDATLWVIVRDDRGGVSWTSHQARVTPE